MKTKWLIPTALVVAGLVVFTVVMWQHQWDFTKLSTRRYETNTYEIDQPFADIAVDTNTADVTFLVAKDGKCLVECYEKRTAKHTVTVEQDTLCIQVTNTKKWYDYIGIGFQSPAVKVYLPETAYTSLLVKESTGNVTVPQDFTFEKADLSASTGDITCLAAVSGTVNIKTSTGHITLQNNTVGALDLTLSTGDVTLSQVVCKETATVQTSTGNVRLQNTVITKTLSVCTDTGDVTFDGADAAEIQVETDTGNVVGSLLTDKVFITQTDTGKVKVPPSVVGGKCEIHTDTGNIILTIQ
jgi:hypothetical protein